MAFWKLSFIMLTVQALIWQCHHFSVLGKILEANGTSYNCRQILVHANPYRSYMSQAMSSRESQGTPITSFHILILLAVQKQHSGVISKIGKTKQKHLPSAFASCTLPFTAKQNEVSFLYLAILCDLFVIVPCIVWYISIISVFASGLDFLPSVF